MVWHDDGGLTIASVLIDRPIVVGPVNVVLNVSEGVKGVMVLCCCDSPETVEGGTDLSPTLCLMDCISLANSSSLLQPMSAILLR